MLKIKFNINEFTIIFSEKIGKKINAEKLSAQPSLFNFSATPFSVPALFFFQLQRFFLLLSLLVSASFFCFFSFGQHFFLLLFSSPSAPLFFFLFFCFIPLSLAHLSSFLLDVLPFFYRPKNIFFSPKPFLLQLKTFFQPKIFFQFSPKILFSAQNVFASAQDTFSVQPKNLSFCGSTPPSFCFFSSCLSFLPLATTYCPFSAQVFSSKPFSAASCLFI